MSGDAFHQIRSARRIGAGLVRTGLERLDASISGARRTSRALARPA